jgi:hypothetical protein
MAITRHQIDTEAFTGAATNQLAGSGTGDATKTTNWRSHFQTAEIMYTRKTQFDPTTGVAEFNYLEVNYTLDTEQEHWWGNASAGDMVQMQKFDVISDSVSGGVGTSGVLRTSQGGIFRREVRTGDEENRNVCQGNLIANKIPGPWILDGGYDSSDTVKGTVMDILVQAQACAPNFELWLCLL